MNFRIEATKPTTADALQSTLEEARDTWLNTTPQEHPEGSQEAIELAQSQEAIEQARLEHKGAQAPNTLTRMVEARAKLIKAQSSRPTVDMQGAIALINDGIAMACARAKNCKSPVRVTIAGHFRIQPNPLHGLHGAHERLSVHVDDAAYG